MRSWPKHWRADNGWISGNGVCFDSGGTKTVSTTNTQQTGPWAPQQQYLTDIFAKAQNLYNAGAPQYYPNSTVAPTAPATQQAWTDIANLANNGSPVLDAANANALNTINGAYLNPGNPYIDAVTQSILGQVQPAVANQFSGSGRYQSTANSPVVAQAISDALAPQLFGNYKNERGLQQQAMGMAPSLTQANYLAPTMLEQAGSQQQAQNQAQLTDLVNRFNYNQNEPYNWLQHYLGLVSGPYGSQMVETLQKPIQTPGIFDDVLAAINAGAGAYSAGKSAYNSFTTSDLQNSQSPYNSGYPGPGG